MPCDIMSETPVQFVVRHAGVSEVIAADLPGENRDAPRSDQQDQCDALIGLADSSTPSGDELYIDHDDDAAPPSELLSLTPYNALSPDEAAELAWLAETRRIIILRLKELVIPVSALLCFLLAVLIEAGLVATVWWLLHWHPVGGGGGTQRGNGSATAVGGIIQSAGLNSLAANPTARWHPGPLPAPPHLPNKPLFTPHTQALALLDNANAFHATLPIIGIKSDHNAWAAPAHRPAPKTVRIKISHKAHGRTRGRGPQPDSRGAQSRRAGTGGGGSGGVVQLFKPGTQTGLGSATGSGPGRGRGAGVGGGGSIVTPPPNPIMPLKYQFAWPAHLVNPKFQLTIRRDGTVANVKVLISSGHAGIDQAIINALMQARFLPNIVGGKPVQSKFVIRYQLTS